MRYPRPFLRYLLIYHYSVAKVEFVKLIVFIAKRVRREGCAAFRQPAHEQLKFRKHRLPVHRSPEAFKEVVYKVGALALIGRVIQKIAHQQHLVAGAGNLRHEYNIVRIAHGLVLY